VSRHQPRQKLARDFGATDVVTERGDEGVACIKDMTTYAAVACVGWAPTKDYAWSIFAQLRISSPAQRDRNARR
jgi:hypothetical protein